MLKANIFKEWLKTRRTFWVLAAIAIILAVYAVMMVRRVEVSKGVEHVWMIMLMKDQVFVTVLRYFPLIAGIVLALSQMYPEMQQKRLKLTLHLPVSHFKLISTMIGVGLAELVIMFGIQTAIVAYYYSTIVVPEMTSNVVLTMIPWMLCGLTAYLFVASICLEGTWRMRVILGLVGMATIAVYFKQDMPQAYNGFLIVLVIMLVPISSLVFRSVSRFKEGRQD